MHISSCQKRGLRFIFRDVKCLSSNPSRFSATATILDVTVTAEALTKAEAKSNVATELLLKLGWDLTAKNRKTINNLNYPNSNNSSMKMQCLSFNSSSSEKMKLENNSQSNSLKENKLNDSTMKSPEDLTSTLSQVQQQLKDL